MYLFYSLGPKANSSSLPKPLPPPPTLADPAVAGTRSTERQRAALGGGSQTILTSGLGLTEPASTAPKTLLGV